MTDELEQRIVTLLAGTPEQGEADTLLTEGYTHALALDAERLRLERRITALAARADDVDAAQDLRRAWLRHRTITAELRELRGLLRRLKDAAGP